MADSQTSDNMLSNIGNKITQDLSNIKLQDLGSTLLYLTLVLYASLVRPELPQFMEVLFKNNLFRILVFFLIVYLAEKENNITLALLVSLEFFVTMNLLTEKEVEQKLNNQLNKNDENNN